MKKSLLIGWSLVFLGFLSWCVNVKHDYADIDNYVKTYTVHTGVIHSSNKYVWVLQSDEVTYLWFKLPGRITNLYVKEGDYVKAGQLLGTLDGNEVKTQYKSAAEMLKSLRAMYNNTKAMFDAQIKAMEAKVQQAKTALEWLGTWLNDTKRITKEQLATAEKQVKQAKIWLETAKTNLEHTKQVLRQKEKDIYSNSKNALAQSKILLTNFVNFVDEIFGISDKNKHKNDSFEPYLSAKNTALKEEIKNDWYKLNSKYQSWKKEVDQLLIDIKNSKSVVDDDRLKDRIYNELKKTRDLLVLSRKLADKVYTAIDDSVPSPFFPQKVINQLKQQAVSFQNNIEAALLTAKWNFLLWVKWSIQNIENFKKQSAMQLDLLQKQYELAKARYETAKQTYEQYKAMAEWKINEVSTKYEVAKKQYEEALKWLQALKKQEQTQLSQIMTQINQVKWHKNLAAVNLSNIKLIAPYSGVITKKMANIWQVVWAWTPVYIIANPNKLKWVFYVPVEEIQNVKVWDRVYIEWLWEVITWTISVIYPSADPISKKVPVEVKLSYVPKNWRLWMFIIWYPMNLEFSWVVIPQDFIRYEYWKPYTFKKENWKFKKVYLVLGICDDNFCIVKKGLKVWDIVK
jgi:multidrug efflux pump subunit AcrA (membrane-fusion protein)